METYVRQPRLFEERLERSCSEVAEVQGLAGHCGEDEVIVLPQASRLEPCGVLGRSVALECLGGSQCEFYVAALPVLRRGKGGAGPGLAPSAPDAQGHRTEVYVFPLEAQKFPYPEPCCHRKHIKGFEAGPTRRL